ncbi:MAG: FecR domain-containing protein [Geminicoccaceae bacterium]
MSQRRTALLGIGGVAATMVLPVSARAPAIGRVEGAAGSLIAVRGTSLARLAVGDEVFVDDILRTDPAGKALIVCGGGLEITIGPATELALRRFAVDASGRLAAVFGLLRGIARLLGELIPGSAIDVDTRTAVASVRATEWIIESADKGTAVLALAGTVVVRALAGGTIELRPGEGTDVAPGAAPRQPARWGEARRREAIARTTL